jgi:hypothetical protein
VRVRGRVVRCTNPVVACYEYVRSRSTSVSEMCPCGVGYGAASFVEWIWMEMNE